MYSMHVFNALGQTFIPICVSQRLVITFQSHSVGFLSKHRQAKYQRKFYPAFYSIRAKLYPHLSRSFLEKSFSSSVYICRLYKLIKEIAKGHLRIQMFNDLIAFLILRLNHFDFHRLDTLLSFVGFFANFQKIIKILSSLGILTYLPFYPQQFGTFERSLKIIICRPSLPITCIILTRFTLNINLQFKKVYARVVQSIPYVDINVKVSFPSATERY